MPATRGSVKVAVTSGSGSLECHEPATSSGKNKNPLFLPMDKLFAESDGGNDEDELESEEMDDEQSDTFMVSFANPEQEEKYQIFCQRDCNIPLSFVLILNLGVLFFTRSLLDRFWEINAVLILEAIMGIMVIIVGCFTLSIRMSAWKRIARVKLSPVSWLGRMRTKLQYLHRHPAKWSVLNDILMIMFPTTCSLNVLGRAMLAPCPPHTSAAETQYCNTGGYGGIPPEPFLLGILSQFMMQIFLRGAKLNWTFISWIIQIALINYAMWIAESSLFVWINLMYVITVSISYELERHGRNLFINNQRALRMSSANANLKMELASRMLEDGQREMEAKRAMVRHISHEIRYVGLILPLALYALL